MKHAVLVSATACALIAGSPAAAQTAGAFMANPAFQGPRPTRCISTVEMQRCTAHDLRAADARMSANYATLHARLRPGTQAVLLAEQRAFLKARDRDCLAKGAGGGSMASLNVAQCWVNTTKARATALGINASKGSSRPGVAPPPGPAGRGSLPASAFVGRWKGGEGTYMKITRRGSGFVIENQWGIDPGTEGTFTGTITSDGLRFWRDGVLETARPSVGDAVNLSALRGKKDCLMVSRDEGYCRY